MLAKLPADSATFAGNRAVGRIELSVAAEPRGNKRRRVCEQGSLRVRFPNVAPGDALDAVIINTAGGMTGGDRFDLVFDVGAGASLTAGGVTKITKQGAGTWVLNVVNTYTGATVVNGGALQMNSTNATTPSVTVNSGGTLRLNVGDALGFTTAKDVPTITSGGTITNVTAASRVTPDNEKDRSDASPPIRSTAPRLGSAGLAHLGTGLEGSGQGISHRTVGRREHAGPVEAL